jgi:hypothetical protein
VLTALAGMVGWMVPNQMARSSAMEPETMALDDVEFEEIEEPGEEGDG